MSTKNIYKIKPHVFETRSEMGAKAASDIKNKIKELLKTKSEIRMIFAAAPSQNEVLEHLVRSNDIEWHRIIAFHMDEYIGLPKGAKQLFSNFLKENLFSLVSFKEVHLIDSSNTADECERYAALVDEKSIDIVCLGIGENGHIAFNDPPVADFKDTELVKEVILDEVCRQQQVNDGCFGALNQVPISAYTLTIPALMGGNHLFCVVPGLSKKEAVYQTLNYPEVSTKWPSTILREHASCQFYFDNDSYNK